MSAATFGLLVLNHFLLCATKKAADAAKKSADIAQQQVTDAEAIQVAKLMLYISPTITPASGDSVLIDWKPLIKNFGQTGATEIRIEITNIPIEGTKGKFWMPNNVAKPVPNPNLAGDSIFPGEPHQYSDFQQQLVGWGNVLRREATGISLWDISYKDVFNKSQVVEFCFYYSPEKTFVRCPPVTANQ